DPLWHFTVKLRQKRVEQLRTLLEHPESVDLDTFNREVWAASSTSLDGQAVKLDKNYRLADGARLAEFEEALKAGRRKFRGNSIWRSGNNVYGSQLRVTAEEKTANIRKALRILNDAELSPLEKARRIDLMPAFGETNATGLVMIYYPDRFSICDEPSKE